MATDLERLFAAMQAQQNQVIVAMQTQHADMMQALLRKPEQRSNLVDSKGIGRPDTLTAKIASGPVNYRVWRLEYSTGLLANYSDMMKLLDHVEQHSSDEFTSQAYGTWLVDEPQLASFAPQVRATLISLCSDEPLSVVAHSSAGPQQGLEALRRLNSRYDPRGPRTTRLLLQKMVSSKPVPLTQLRTTIEEQEQWATEYELRSGTKLQEELKSVALESLLMEPLKTHIRLNSERYSTYSLLSKEVVSYDEKASQEKLVGSSGASPMEVNALSHGASKSKGKDKNRKGKGGDAKSRERSPRISLRTRVRARVSNRSASTAARPDTGPKIVGPQAVPRAPPSTPRNSKGKKGKGKCKGKGKGKAVGELGEEEGDALAGDVGSLFMLELLPKMGTTSKAKGMTPPWRRKSPAVHGTPPKARAESKSPAPSWPRTMWRTPPRRVESTRGARSVEARQSCPSRTAASSRRARSMIPP